MANNIKGITIEIGGNTEPLKKALQDVNKDLNATNKELKQVENGLKLDPTNITLLNQKQTLLTKAIEDSTKKLEALRKAKEKADNSADVDKNSAAYRQLERDIETAKRQVDNYSKSLEQTKETINNTTNSSANLYEKITALATGFTAVKQACDVAFGAVKAIGGQFFDTVVGAGKLADDINTLATQFNMTTDQVQAFQKASNLIDVDFNTIAGAYNKLTQQLNSKGAKDTFKELGVSIKDSNGELRDINDVFTDTISALGKIDNETEKDAMAMKIFGKSASNLATLIDGGAETLADFTDYLHDNSMILSGEQLTSLNNMNDAYDTLQVTLESIGGKVGVIFAEPFTKAFEAVNDIVLKVFKYLDNVDIKPLIEQFKSMVSEVAERLQPTFDRMAEFFNTTLLPMLSEMWQFLKDNILPILKDVGAVVFDVVIANFENLWTVFETVLNVIKDIWEMFQNLYKVLEDTGAIDWIRNAFEGFLGVIEKVLESIKQLYEWLGNVIGKVSEFVSTGVSKVAGWFGGLFSSGGYGNMMASGGFSGAITLNSNITVNTSRAVTPEDIQGWGKMMADTINLELGRRL